MSEGHTVRVQGAGFTGLLATAFIVLRLCNVIHWSWLWVLAPIWMPLALLVLILMVVLIAAVLQESKR